MSTIPRLLRQRTLSGFSLIELLVVIAIMGILAVLVIPAVGSISATRALNSASQALVDQLSLGRQHAMAQGRRVRWEMVEVDTPEGPQFRASRLMEFKAGQWNAISRWNELPVQVRLNPTTTRTSLLGNQQALAGSVVIDGKPYSSPAFFGITFLPDGTTLLPADATNNPSLTIESRSGQPDGSGNYPNWAAIVVNPVTGVAQVYRP